MKERVIRFAHWFAGRLNGLATMLEQMGRPAETQSKFVDLAPTDQADNSGVYSEALFYATNNAKVSNIALTGPYGSGKSSIIQSFLRKYRRPALHISLAAFVPEADTIGGNVSRQEIERSILQQMLYGAYANKLPLSRFKRIQSPGVWSIFKSLYIMLGLLALWYALLQREAILSGTFFTPLAFSNWFNLGIFAFAALFLWMTVHHFYVASFGVSLKSFSLKAIEIRPASDDQDSILNRHLDEIVYFFQSTDYELVVIEDLDRFDNADIFVTLREINSLVNENAGVKRTIRFLYALRDDMFVNTDRTKFFEFIIPVIPIINSSNSIDMVLEQGKRLALGGHLDRQFLREVSRYLTDLRLIQNIFNEYAIYVSNLEFDDENVLDANKLLAILIYKNVYPSDFEQLHRGEGNLANILNRQDELIAHGAHTYKSEIAELEERIETAERQTPSDLKELRYIYAMALVEKLPANYTSVSLDGRTWIAPKQLAEHDAFEQMIKAPHLTCRTVQNQQQKLDISNLQDDVAPQKSYLQRKAELENKAVTNKSDSVRRIRDLRSRIAKLRSTKLNELIRLNADRAEDLFDGFGEKGELARFLILEGHLDDTYYQYTSLFHSGRLSPNDNKFLIKIRAFATPEPDFPIDNPKEVVAAMRDEDFRQSYVLNVKLVDCLLSDQGRYDDQIRKLFEFIASEFESCEGFFDAYYSAGRNVPELLLGLSDAWKNFVPTAIASPSNISHVAHLVTSVPEGSLDALADGFDELPEFVSSNLPEILAHTPELAPARLESLNFEVEDLAAINEHPGIIRFVLEKGLFELTIENLEYIYREILGQKNIRPLRARNYTTLRLTNSAILMRRVDRDFDLYLRDVLLQLPENSSEDATAILAIIRRDKLDHDNLRQFLGRQANRLPSLKDVPDKLHAMLFELHMIEPKWENCLAFMEGGGFGAAVLVSYLDREDIRAAILKHPIPNSQETLPLRQFLLEAATLCDAAYQEYAQALPNPFKKFPEDLEPNKLRILIEEGTITFTKESFDALADNTDLQVLFVAANIDTYLADPDTFMLTDDFRDEILRTEINDAAKRAIIDLMDLNTFAGLPKRAALIGPILDRTDANISGLDANIVQSLIAHSTPIATKISLFNKYHSVLTDDDVRQVLANLPRPFSEIRKGYKTPRLRKAAENLELVKWLDSRNIISSWSEGILADDIKVNLYRR